MRLIPPAFIGSVLALLVAGAASARQEPPIMPEVAQAYQAALAVSPTPRRLAADQTHWLSRRDLDAVGEPGEGDRDRIAWLNERAAMDVAMQAAVGPVPETGACPGAALADCVSPISGVLTAPGVDRLAWRIETGRASDGTPLHAMVIGDFRSAQSGPVPRLWVIDYAERSAPHLVEQDGRRLLALPARHDFLNDGEDRVFEWRPRGFVEIDSWSWRDTVAEHLPAGLTLPRNVALDLSTMTARTPLWVGEGDTDEPTGGEALLRFVLDGDRLVLIGVRVRDPLLDDVAPLLPVDLYSHVSRRLECARLPGQMDHDAARRTRIETRLADLDCANLLEDGARLRQTYAAQPMWTALLDRLDARSR